MPGYEVMDFLNNCLNSSILTFYLLPGSFSATGYFVKCNNKNDEIEIKLRTRYGFELATTLSDAC